MRIWDEKAQEWVDADPVQLAAGYLREAHGDDDDAAVAAVDKALKVLRQALPACPRCGAYADQPHTEECKIEALREQQEQRMLRSYEGGPRVWDAASLQPAVISLESQGLIERVRGNTNTYQLTEKGRQALDAG
jgi:hypothetical protein